MKNLKNIVIVIVFCIVFCNCFSASAHNIRLSVGSDNCIHQSDFDGEDEMWYCLAVCDNGSQLEIRHIPETTAVIKYYFMESKLIDGIAYYWDTDISTELSEEIKQAYVDSMMLWNNVYYYQYDENNNAFAQKIISIEEGTYNDHNLLIYPYKSSSFTAETGPSLAGIDSSSPDYMITINDAINNEIPHRHYGKWQVSVDISDFFVSEEEYLNLSPGSLAYVEQCVNVTRMRTGAHEIGHMLGIFDVDKCCNGQTNFNHHEELIMGYGDDLNCITHITYKDIAGVSITRGFHTDDDHRWMIRTREDGSQYLICSLCNGIRTEYELDEDGTYEGQTPVVYGSCNDNHSLAGGNMLLVATDCVRDFYKCLKCRYIEEVEHSHRYTEWTFLNRNEHLEMCLCGWRGTETSAHVIRAGEAVGNTSPCIYCGYPVIIDPFGPPGQIIHNVQKVSVNGSYILPNGIIVLVDEDVEAYENGTLVFYDKNNLPELQ